MATKKPKKPSPTSLGILKLRALLHRRAVANPGCPESLPYRRVGETVSPRPRPALDGIERRLKELGRPLTRENYFALDNLKEDPSKPLDPELEAYLPEAIQLPPEPSSDPPEPKLSPAELRKLWLDELAENAMEHNPGLTKERAIEFIENSGF